MLQPLCNAAIYYVIFGLIITGARGGIENYAAFVVIGILMFQSTMRSVSTGPGIIRGGASMIRAFSFPQAAVPLSAELKDALQMRFTLPVALFMIMVIPPNEMPGLAWLLVIPIFVLQTILNMGITFLMARLGFELPDLTQIMSVVSRLLMYGSGVIFPIDRLLESSSVPAIIPFLVEINPIFHMLKLYRAALIDNTSAPLGSWLIFGGWAIGLLIVGFLAFWHGEAKYGDDR